MLDALIAIVITSFLIAVAFFIYHYWYNNYEDTINNKIRTLVGSVNDSQLYVYNFDKQQEENIKNVEKNLAYMFQENAELKDKFVTKTALASSINTNTVTSSNIQIGPYTFSTGESSWLRVQNSLANAGIMVDNIQTSNAYINGDMIFKGDNSWVIGTPTDSNKTMIIAPVKNTMYDLAKKVEISNTGYVSAVGGGVAVRGGASIYNPNNEYTVFPSTVDNMNYIRGDTRLTGNLSVVGDIKMTRSNPGPMLEVNNGKSSDRYGIGQYPNGSMRIYTSGDFGPATVNLSVARDANTFTDVLQVKSDNTVSINGLARFNNGLCIGNVCLRDIKGNLQACDSSFKTCKDL